MAAEALSPGEVLVKSAYSSINFKDALAGTGKGRILRHYPLNGGIDVAGHVVASTDPAFKEGDAVLCTGSGLSETRDEIERYFPAGRRRSTAPGQFRRARNICFFTFPASVFRVARPETGLGS